VLSTSAPQFMQRYAMMASAPDKESPIVLLDHLEFLPTFYYAPASLASRLTFLLPSETDHIAMAEKPNSPGQFIATCGNVATNPATCLTLRTSSRLTIGSLSMAVQGRRAC
jgi:hypothetical protein